MTKPKKPRNPNPNTSGLVPLTDEQRQKGHKTIRERAARRKRYRDTLAELKEDQLNAAKSRMVAGVIRSPADMLMDMIQEQEMIMANPDLKSKEKQYNIERDLMLKMYDRYASLTGANAASTVNIDITSETEEEKTPEQIQEELLKYTENLRVIGPKKEEE